jgi:hypothetical protein
VIHFLLLMLIPFLISTVVLVYFKGKDTVVDFLIQIGAVALVMGIGLGLCYWGRTTDTEILNGQVTGKQRVEVSCSHSYECNCYYTSDSKGNMTKHCSTCYEHPYDVDWQVTSNVGTVDIDRLSSQGLEMPPRWGAAYVGEPFSTEHSYTNYILANPDSVLLGQKGDLQTFGPIVPKYPRVYDYYKVHHVINENVPFAPGVVEQWDWLLNQADKTLGPTKQVNVILVFARTTDPAYVYAFKDAWIGGKKNDAVVLIGSSDGHTIAWDDIVSWGTNKTFDIQLRDSIREIGTLDKRDDIIKAINDTTASQFERLHMKTMKYLTSNFQPSSTQMFVLLIIGIILSGGLCWASVAGLFEKSEKGWDQYDNY